MDGRFPLVMQAGPWKGLTQLRGTLQQHGKFPQALKLLMAEIFFSSESSLLKDLHHICGAMVAKGDILSMIETAHARIFIAPRLAAKGEVGDAKRELTEVTQLRTRLARNIGEESIKHLDHYINVATFMVDHPDSADQPSAQFLKFAATARELKDYGDECSCLTTAVQRATKEHSIIESMASRDALDRAVSLLLNCESETTHYAFYLCQELNDVAFRFILSHQESEFLEHLTDFEARFPKFDIPVLKEQLLQSAVTAAQNIGDDVAMRRYQSEAHTVFAQCPFAVVGEDGTATLDQAREQIEHEFAKEEPSLWRALAVTIVVRWIKAEVAQGITTDQEAKEILGMTGREPTCHHITGSVSNISDILDAIDSSALASELYGTSTPTPPEIWNPRFNRLEEWLRKDGHPSSTATRHRLLDMMQCMRVTSYRQYCTSVGANSDYELIKCLQYEVERRLAINQSIDPAVASIDFCRMEVAGSTLSISFIPQAVADGAVTDEMMLEAISVHEDVLPRYKAIGNTFFVYNILKILSRLMWQRYYNFKSIPPIAALPYLTEADEIYCETRRERWRGPRLLETLGDLSKQEADPKRWCMARRTNEQTGIGIIYTRKETPQDLWHRYGDRVPYSIYPPRKWERPRSQSQNLLRNLLLNIFSTLLNPHHESLDLPQNHKCNAHECSLVSLTGSMCTGAGGVIWIGTMRSGSVRMASADRAGLGATSPGSGSTGTGLMLSAVTLARHSVGARSINKMGTGLTTELGKTGVVSVDASATLGVVMGNGSPNVLTNAFGMILLDSTGVSLLLMRG